MYIYNISLSLSSPFSLIQVVYKYHRSDPLPESPLKVKEETCNVILNVHRCGC